MIISKKLIIVYSEFQYHTRESEIKRHKKLKIGYLKYQISLTPINFNLNLEYMHLTLLIEYLSFFTGVLK